MPIGGRAKVANRAGGFGGFFDALTPEPLPWIKRRVRLRYRGHLQRWQGFSALVCTLNPAGPFSMEFWTKSLDNSGFRTVFSSQNRNVGRSGYAMYHHVNDTALEVHMGNASTVTMFLYGPSRWN